jgi:hypothetical protein
MGDDELVALAVAAKEIDRSREWLRLRVVAGEVKSTRIGRVIGVPRSEIRRLKAALKGTKKPRGHWPKGKPRKSTPYLYPMAGDVATSKLIADRGAPPHAGG